MKMKASTQYNDYLGTSAADISDYQDLEKYLINKGVDTTRYKPIGVEIYCGYADFFNVRFICKDSNERGNKAVTLGFEKGITKDEFFNLFKRFNVILTFAKGSDYSDWDLDDDTIMIDDRESAE